MREILFRGKRADNGEWVFSGTVMRFIGNNDIYMPNLNDKCTVIVDVNENLPVINAMFYKVIPETVGQYTSLTDKNGKKIFEGDICRFREWNNGDMCWIGKVNYKHQQFVISGGKNKECATPFTLVMSRFIPKNIEVIGNIHDNPELLKGE